METNFFSFVEMHVETAGLAFEHPGAVHLGASHLTVIHHGVLAEVLLLKVSHSLIVNPALQNEFTNLVMTFASHYFTRVGMEIVPLHFVMFPKLFVDAFPGSRTQEFVGLRHVVVGRRDATFGGHFVTDNRLVVAHF
jgi:hypothetical protein